MDASAHKRVSNDNHAPEILLAKARLLFNAADAGAIIQVAVIIILALIQRDSTPLLSSLPLILTISAICLYRMWLSRRYREKAETPENVKFCLDRHTAALALSGLVFGAAAILYIPGASPELQIFTALVLGGLASGAMVSLLPSVRTYVMFVLPAVAPAIVLFLMQGTELGYTTGALATLLTLFLIAAARWLNTALIEQTRLRLEYQNLFEDLSDEKRKIENLNDQLASEIHDRRNAEEHLLYAIQESENAGRVKSDFLSSMSHELRTPLNSILGYAQLLNSYMTIPDRSMIDHYSKEIISAGENLLGLVTQILNYAETETSTVDPELERIELAAGIRKCLAAMESRAAAAGITMTFDANGEDNIAVWADENRLHQIVTTFLRNGIKYNPPGGSVAVKIDRRANGLIHISVRDTGDGIPKDRLGSLFEPFNRLGRESGNVSGTGLGLATAKHLVNSLGGKIGVESEFGEGSNFWVELPEAAPGEVDQTVSGTENAATRPSGKLILCVEDNRANLLFAEKVVRLIENTSFVGATTRHDALSAISRRIPDLIILDLNLSDVDGVNFFKTLRSSERTAHVPVIALTARAMPADVRLGKSVGFDEYLTKPVDVSTLKSTIEDFLQNNNVISIA